jgi:hypothetical protein
MAPGSGNLTGLQAGFNELAAVLGELGIPYMVGGSIASGAHGIPRYTNDVDIVADITNADIAPFASRLTGSFYVDPETICEALEHNQSFNLIHLASGYKFDIFPAVEPCLEMQIKRSKMQDVPVAEGVVIHCPVATAEDILLAKLVWYRMGGEVSDRQWNDVRGIRAIQGPALDRSYLDQWARYLKVEDLLERLFSEVLE